MENDNKKILKEVDDKHIECVVGGCSIRFEPNRNKRYCSEKCYRKQYYMDHTDSMIESSKQYYVDNIEKKIEYGKRYYMKNADKRKIYHQNTVEVRRESRRRYRINNKDADNAYQIKYKKEKRMNDPIFNLIVKLRDRSSKFIRSKNFSKNKHFFDYIGCTGQELCAHIEKQFNEGMTWDKVLSGEIEIDHIMPLSGAITIEDAYRLCHFSNLQPLWKKDNRRKSSRMDWVKKQTHTENKSLYSRSLSD